ncbi:MAG TPA: hypothetical protein PKD10_02385 [Paracoccaceae bacterium]|nr:hypothetical protein [Paracoccaceae bacterium]HMO71784.1 hypothetical protein [Paracoccaceae bacterium]
MRQAILAVVAAAPGQIKARRFLQEMFWGAAEPERASASLRSALYMLKLDLAALGRDVLCTDRQAVSLAPGRIAVDTVSETARGSAAFLEGMDLNLADAELFEDWLRTMRSAHAGATDETDAGDAPLRPPVAAPSGIAPPSRHGRLALGLLPTAHAGLAPADLLRADTVCDAIARLVSQTTAVPVHDMRGAEIPAVPLPVENGTGPTHLMQAVVERRRDRLTLRLRLTEGATRQVLWLSEPVDAATVDDAEVATPATDALLDRLRASPAADNAPDLFPFTALAALFSLDNALIARTEAQIDRMIDGGGPPVLHCLRAFTQVFRANEGFGRATPLDAEALCSVIGAIPLSDPMLPLCESLAGYAAHMMLGRNDIAEALLESACARAPHLALNLDHLAVLRLVQGDTDGADQALRRCLRAGAFSPWRYTYDVTGAMIAIARGDAREALLFANRAIMRKPRFLGALRYAMAGFALAGNAADARRMQARILALRPEHDLSAWTEGLLRRTPPHMGRALAASLRTNGLV